MQIFENLFSCVKRNKGYFIFLIIFAILAITLGVFAAINFSGGILAISLSNIAYVKFLRDKIGLMTMIFNLLVTLIIFFVAICLLSTKKFLVPFAVILFGYLVYSQAVVFVAIIIDYGFLNVMLFSAFLLVFLLLIFLLFILAMTSMVCLANGTTIKECCDPRETNIVICLVAIVLLVIVFSLLLSILKSFVLLLVY